MRFFICPTPLEAPGLPHWSLRSWLVYQGLNEMIFVGSHINTMLPPTPPKLVQDHVAPPDLLYLLSLASAFLWL